MGTSLSISFRPSSSSQPQDQQQLPRGSGEDESPASILEDHPDANADFFGQLDETLGHSFCYVRSSNRFLLHSPSDLSPSDSIRFDRPVPANTSIPPADAAGSGATTEPAFFKSISGASVGANASFPRSVLALRLENECEYVADNLMSASAVGGFFNGSGIAMGNAFESTSSFCAVELQPVPRGKDGFFLSSPVERGAMSGPLVDVGPDGQGSPLPLLRSTRWRRWQK